MAAKYRNFVFTHNNYGDTSLEDSLMCKYILYGKEVAASGTPHLQGFVCFVSQRPIHSVIAEMPGCHIEVCKFPHEAMAYCKKDGNWTERGIKPLNQSEKGESNKRRWDLIHSAAEEGRLDDIDYEIRFKFYRNIDAIYKRARLDTQLEDTTEQMLWYWGNSGTGKSRKARTDHPNAYLKMCNKWWDGYDHHSTVLIEDLDKSHSVLGHHLKIWADRYPFLAEVKGGAVKIRPTLIIVTSNYHPTAIWDDANMLEPIMRRFKCIEFKSLKL